jgi:dTDP-4-amino-4,6-dideoxygalactose transaminase
MDAIEIGLRALGIGPGDEVITTSLTAFATVLAIMRAGATPVLADIDSDTALLSIESAQRCLTPRTRAVVLVHLYGHLRAMKAWTTFCAAHNLDLIEDCAQAHGAFWRGTAAGAFGRVGAYSFYPTKNLGAVGDGGMLVTNERALAEAARRLRNYGQSERYRHAEIGLNSRLDELQAAILTERLSSLPDFTSRRREIAAAYRTGLANPQVTVLSEPEEESAHVYHLFVVRCAARNELETHLQRCGVQTLIHYPIPIHLQKPCRSLPQDPGGLAFSCRHAATCISLPCHPQMQDGDVHRVIDAVNAFVLS